jgi:hypothetical protein
VWKWIWPRVGSTPISQNTDSEMFDRTDYPYTETFVREAIQNTLDARLDPARPAVISFKFHRGSAAAVRDFVGEAIDLRRQAALRVPSEWDRGEIDWLCIEDFNTKGLDGDLGDRLGNFWNYWLNFGLSNKDGHGRGGRGIGRVTFLIASRVQTVLGITRRMVDDVTAASGMVLLRAMRTREGLRSTHAYLAAAENQEHSIFRLHDGKAFHSAVVQAFKLAGYTNSPNTSGLALAIPYPHEELTPDGIRMLLDGKVPFGKQVVIQARKRPDFVLPSFAHLAKPRKGKDRGLILSAKTTLRERWKQVEREMHGCELFLGTVDENIAANAIEEMESMGIILVVPEHLKKSKETEYERHSNVLSFKTFFGTVVGKRMLSW